jgi:acetyl-CoA acyltransferase
MDKLRQAVIVDGIRTPFGRAHPTKGWFRDVRGDELAASCLRELIARNKLEPTLVDDVILGIALPAEELSLNAARQIALLAGLPVTCPAVTVNRLCGSSLQALHQAVHAIEAGAADVVLVGGVERMSVQSPPPDSAFNPRLSTVTSKDSMSMGLTAEFLSQRYAISRTDQDAYAARSHQLTATSKPAAALQPEILPTWGRNEVGEQILITHDQCLRPETTGDSLARLPAAFMTGGTVTAGNSSPRNDGAAALLVMSQEKAVSLGYWPLAAVRGTAVVGISPCEMGLGPVPAIGRLLARAGKSLDDLDCLELNEAFAAQVLACVQVGKLPMDKLNLRGGAISIGHPLGGSGTRLILSLLHSLHSTNSEWGIAALCVGMGQGMATLVQRC